MRGSFALFALAAFPLGASELRLDFVLAQPASWQQFALVDRMAGSVFPGLGLRVEPSAPGAEGFGKLPKERQEDVKAHLAIYRQSPELYLRFLQILSLSPFNISWRDGAALAGVKPDEIVRKIEGEAGDKLLADAAGPAGPRLRLVVEAGAGKRETEDLPLETNFLTLASAINNRLPQTERVAAIGDLVQAPKPKVELIIINGDNYAPWAKVEPKAIEHLKGIAWDLEMKTYSGASPQAKALLGEVDGALLPLVMFRPQDDAGRKILDDFAAKGALEKKGKKQEYYLAEGFTNGGVFWSKKESKEKDLRLFVMSQCPYGVAAQKALLNLEQDGKLPQGIKLSYHYIVDKIEDKDGKSSYRSLHGASELEENVRQMVLQKHAPDKLRCYLAKRLADVNSSLWNDALESCGVDAEQFKKLYKENQESLLEEDGKLSRSLSIRSSPTFLWRGRYVLGGLTGLSNLEEFKGVDIKSASEANLPAGKCQ